MLSPSKSRVFPRCNNKAFHLRYIKFLFSPSLLPPPVFPGRGGGLGKRERRKEGTARRGEGKAFFPKKGGEKHFAASLLRPVPASRRAQDQLFLRASPRFFSKNSSFPLRRGSLPLSLIPSMDSSIGSAVPGIGDSCCLPECGMDLFFMNGIRLFVFS